MSLRSWVLLFFILGTLLLSAVPARAQDDEAVDEDLEVSDEEADGKRGGKATQDADEEEVEEEEARVVGPAADIDTSALFPGHPDKKLPIGQEVTVLVQVANRGNSDFNITHIGAHLHSPFDFSYYIQNFTAREVSVLVEDKEQVAVQYSFRPDKSLDPVDIWLSGYIVYNDTKGNQYRSTFFNGTVELVDASSGFDFSHMFTYVLVAAAIGLVAYFTLVPKTTKRTHHAPRADKGPRTERDTSEWTEGLIKKPDQRSHKVARKSNKQRPPKAAGDSQGKSQQQSQE